MVHTTNKEKAMNISSTVIADGTEINAFQHYTVAEPMIASPRDGTHFQLTMTCTGCDPVNVLVHDKFGQNDFGILFSFLAAILVAYAIGQTQKV